MLRNFILFLLSLTACAEEDRAVTPAADGGDSCGATQFARTYPDGGPCDDSAPIHAASWQDHRGAYVVTCDSKAPGERGCQGIPNDIWGRCSVRRCESTEVYPEGCTLFMPTENPYYPGSPQSCTCQVSPVGAEPRWGCGL